MSALKGDQENAFSGKQKDPVQEETHVVSATEIISVESQHSRPILAPRSQTQKMTEEDFRKETPLGRSSLSGNKGQRPCKNYLERNCTNPSYVCLYPPVCGNYKTHWRCKFGDTCLLDILRLTVSPAKS